MILRVYTFTIIVLLLAFCLSGCRLHSKFSKSDSFSESEKVSDLYVIVVGDKDTKAAMNYLNDFLTDSLKKSNISVGKVFYCCRDEKTDLNTLIPTLLPNNKRPNHVLTIVITRVVVGYGAISKREMQLDLFNTTSQKRTWTGNLELEVAWFRSDIHFKKAAVELTQSIIAELKKKGIV